MNTSMNRSLAKVLGPALLLTATLALPVESFGAPSPDPKAYAADKEGKKDRNQRNANKAQRQENRRQVQTQRQENRKQVQVQRQQNRGQVQAQQKQQARRQVAQFQAQRKAEQRAAQQQAQVQRQQASRQAQLRAQQQAQWQHQQDRNRQLQLQRQAEWRRQEEARRLAEQRRNNRYYPGDRYARDRRAYNNQYDQYHRSGERFHIDGFVVEENNGYCSLLRDHRGHVFALVGNIGDIVQGDHLRLQGRVVGGEACDWRGTAFEVIQVKTLWDNNRHESASYDYQRDRYSFEEFLDNRY